METKPHYFNRHLTTEAQELRDPAEEYCDQGVHCPVTSGTCILHDNAGLARNQLESSYANARKAKLTCTTAKKHEAGCPFGFP